MITSNKHKIADRLRSKGWETHYISKTVGILKKSEKRNRRFDGIVLFLVTLIILIGNAFIILGVIPIIVANELLSLIAISVLGFGFGMFLDILLREYEIRTHHYLLGGFLVPALSGALLLAGLRLAGENLNAIGIFFRANPLLIVTLYSLAVLMPHFLYKAGVYNGP